MLSPDACHLCRHMGDLLQVGLSTLFAPFLRPQSPSPHLSSFPDSCIDWQRNSVSSSQISIEVAADK